MDILIVYLIASSLPLVSLGWKACPQSIPTVSYVSRCPSNAEEWKSAAARKGCRAVGMNQSCSDDGSFEYHCVLNEDGTKLMEVCAPMWYMSGYCARFSIASKRIINNPDLDCSAFDTPCPARFPSNESFKYQMCYKNVRDMTAHDCIDKMGNGSNNTIGMPSAKRVQKKQPNTPALIAFLAIFITTSLCLLILLLFGKKIKRIIFHRDADTTQGETRLMEFIDQEDHTLEEVVPLADEARTDAASESNAEKDNGPAVVQETNEEEWMDIVSLSKERKERISLKDVESIGDLREQLCKKLDYQMEHLWIVNKENGNIYEDDVMMNQSTKASCSLMLGNKMRADGPNEDGRKYKKSNRSQVKCRMECDHLTDAETLLKLIRDTLPGTEYTELKCPLCSEVWKERQLIEKCHMSEDERIFFDRVLEVNRKTKDLFKGSVRNEGQKKPKDVTPIHLPLHLS